MRLEYVCTMHLHLGLNEHACVYVCMYPHIRLHVHFGPPVPVLSIGPAAVWPLINGHGIWLPWVNAIAHAECLVNGCLPVDTPAPVYTFY